MINFGFRSQFILTKMLIVQINFHVQIILKFEYLKQIQGMFSLLGQNAQKLQTLHFHSKAPAWPKERVQGKGIVQTLRKFTFSRKLTSKPIEMSAFARHKKL